MNVAELIVEETKELGDISRLQVAPELAELLSILAHACRPRFAVEVGTFTGLSSLKIAEALPEEGRLLCCDIPTGTQRPLAATGTWPGWVTVWIW